MMGFKKKLTSFLPLDAQSRLQNVLTVEWEGQGKTVLVELPNSDVNRNDNNEVEMAGLTSNSGAYGRLNDDEYDDDRSYSRPSRSQYNNNNSDSYYSSSSSSSQHRKQSSYSSKNLPPLPPTSSGSASGSGYNTSSSSSKVGYRNQNPFEPEYNSPQPSSSSTYSSSSSPYTGFTPQFSNQATFGNNTEINSGGSLNRNKQKTIPNPWGKTYRADDIDFLGDDLGNNNNNNNGSYGYNDYNDRNGLRSPTSSAGTRDSQGSSNANSLENPFR
ncbi:uncharacterized protein L201_003516 [Kwoniella dendrophila CBS 6074]|uniref:Uncharacterized protein n=1 Tax=Kwoniella dendrophila CBS 6074 TaxID=1295534 RepID=A0AAX4JVR3_9TREE